MSSSDSARSTAWVTRRTHLQVSKAEVLPVVFKSRQAQGSPSTSIPTPVPPAFPATQVEFADCLPLVREWLSSHLERMYRVGTMNVKPGSLETPDVLRNRKFCFTLWFEPTAATFAVMTPKLKARAAGTPSADVALDGYVPTPQTLHILAELEE